MTSKNLVIKLKNSKSFGKIIEKIKNNQRNNFQK